MSSRSLPKLASGVIAAGFGGTIIAFACGLAKQLLKLCEDDGTESFTVGAGPFGIIGCWAFVILLAFGGVLVSCYGVYLLRYQHSDA